MPRADTVVDAVAQNLAAALSHLGLSQADIQRKWRIPQSTVSRLLNPNLSNPNFEIKTLARLCEVLGLDIHAVLVPAMPVDLLFSRRTAAHLANWRDAPEHAREHVEKVAEGAIKYTSPESRRPKQKLG